MKDLIRKLEIFVSFVIKDINFSFEESAKGGISIIGGNSFDFSQEDIGGGSILKAAEVNISVHEKIMKFRRIVIPCKKIMVKVIKKIFSVKKSQECLEDKMEEESSSGWGSSESG